MHFVLSCDTLINTWYESKKLVKANMFHNKIII